MTERFEELKNWLASCPALKNKQYSFPVPASNDASFRRYYRIELKALNAQDLSSLIIMDAPPAHEDCLPFIQVSQQLAQLGLNVPKVLAQNLEQGFLLLTDLGNTTFLSVLNETNVESYYNDAFDALVSLQVNGKSLAKALPSYDAQLLNTEMALFPDWLLKEHLNLELSPQNYQAWSKSTEILTQNALKQPLVYVHRDYHSRNLMVTSPETNTGKNPGILDYQDAVYGALTYDAVSLIRDCYIVWPADQVKEWQRQYFLKLVAAGELSKADYNGFVKSMDLMGIQRHLKAAGIFARLFHRDGKDGYLNDIPTTLNYILSVSSQYAELHDLAKLIETQVLPKMAEL